MGVEAEGNPYPNIGPSQFSGKFRILRRVDINIIVRVGGRPQKTYNLREHLLDKYAKWSEGLTDL